MSTREIKGVLEREGQLNAIAYTMIVVLLAIIVALVIPLVTEVEIPDIVVLDDPIARTLFFGLVLMSVLYLVDQHRRLRIQLLDTHHRLEVANTEITSAYERLSFAQHTASVMTSLTETNALERVLGDSTRHFGAHAAAVVGDEVIMMSDAATDGVEAESAVLQVALDVVRAGKAMATKESAHGGEAIAVPLRIHGELNSVICLWRQGDPFPTDQLEGLILMARIIELSMENRILLTEVEDQLSGTLAVLSTLIDQRLPGYERSSTRIAERAAAIGRIIGLTQRQITDLRIAALLSDVGMLQLLPETRVLDAFTSAEESRLRAHPAAGAAVAKRARFSCEVQEAILSHHERLNGTGFPAGRRGGSIPVAARVLAVCDVYDSLTTPRSDQPRHTPTQAISALMKGAGTLYDAEIVRAFMQVVGHDGPDVAGRIPHAEEPRYAESTDVSVPIAN